MRLNFERSPLQMKWLNPTRSSQSQFQETIVPRVARVTLVPLRCRQSAKHKGALSPQSFLLSLLGDLEIRSFGGGADFIAQQKYAPLRNKRCRVGQGGWRGVVSSKERGAIYIFLHFSTSTRPNKIRVCLHEYSRACANSSIPSLHLHLKYAIILALY